MLNKVRGKRYVSTTDLRQSLFFLLGLAIIFAMTKWEQLLYGQKIRVVTDHRPLRYLSGHLANNNVRLVRWRLFLQS